MQLIRRFRKSGQRPSFFDKIKDSWEAFRGNDLKKGFALDGLDKFERTYCVEDDSADQLIPWPYDSMLYEETSMPLQNWLDRNEVYFEGMENAYFYKLFDHNDVIDEVYLLPYFLNAEKHIVTQLIVLYKNKASESYIVTINKRNNMQKRFETTMVLQNAYCDPSAYIIALSNKTALNYYRIEL